MEKSLTVADLIEELKRCPPDFKVKLSVLRGFSTWPDYEHFTINEIADIGHSDEVVILSGELID